ncbi:MAG: hypothetical protein ACRDCY_14145 [Aeromonas veronii]
MKIIYFFREFLNVQVLSPYGSRYHYFLMLFPLVRKRIIPLFVVDKIIRALKKTGNTKDAERMVIHYFKGGSQAADSLDYLIKLKSYIKVKSIFSERCPVGFYQKYGYIATYKFALCLFKSQDFVLAEVFFTFLSKIKSNILIDRRLAYIYSFKGERDLAYITLQKHMKNKKFNMSDHLFMSFCVEVDNVKSLELVKKKYAI